MLKSVEVTVVTDPELGLDCVIRVVVGNEDDAKEELSEGYNDLDSLIFTEKTIYLPE